MKTQDKAQLQAGYVFLLIFIVLTLGIVAAGFLYYRNYEKHYRGGVEQQLSTVAELKVDELADWRAERLADAAVFFKNASFSGMVRQLLEKPKDSAGRDQLRIWLGRFQAAPGYDRVFLLDTHGVERISVPDTPEPVAAYLLEQAPEILRSGRVTFVDFHRDVPDGPIHISVLVPVFDDREDTRVMGILVFRIDPEKYLYPYISRWPTPSRTAETLIVRRDGNDVLFLNELRFQKNTALNLRSPLGNKDMPAVKAVLGQEGFVEGKDYRGVPVLAALRAVPDSPWFLVARMDVAEAFAPLREREWVMIVLVGSLLLCAGGGTGFVWRHQRARFYRERYHAAEALRKSEEKYHLLIETANESVVVAQDGLLKFVNPAALSLLGEYSEQELMDRPFPEFIHPDDRSMVVENYRRRIANEAVHPRYAFRVITRDGIVKWVELSAALTEWQGKPATLNFLTDITERKRAEEALVIQKRIGDIFLTIPGDEMYYEVLKIILEVMESPFGVFGYIDEDGALVVPSMTRHIWDKCQVPQKTITFPPETWGDSSWPRAFREKKPNYSNEISTKTPEGHVSLRRHISLPILYQGEVIGLFQVANKETDYGETDISTLENIARYIAPILSARLQRRRHEEELLEKNDELIRFTYTVSHDLKSPLVTIRTFLGYLEQDIRKPDVAIVDKDLKYIRNAADKVSRLLDELLELSRIGRKVSPHVEVPLQEVVKEALDLAAGRIAERGVTVKVTKEPIQLFGDLPRLVEVFQNLVDNAVKFMGRQRAPRVEIGVDEVGGETVLFVRDNGIGIDPQYQPKLFGLFEKLDPGAEGTGIGLALVKRIVEVHGGRIWVESEGPGKGATFRFTLAETKRKPA